MKDNFWKKVAQKKPFFVLAPMADVTDMAFRRIITKIRQAGRALDRIRQRRMASAHPEGRRTSP